MKLVESVSSSILTCNFQILKNKSKELAWNQMFITRIIRPTLLSFLFFPEVERLQKLASYQDRRPEGEFVAIAPPWSVDAIGESFDSSQAGFAPTPSVAAWIEKDWRRGSELPSAGHL